MKLKSILLGATLSALTLPAFAEILVEHQYARAASPAARSGAVFLVVHNTGPEADRLIAVETDAAKRSDLHTNIFEDGIARMKSVPEGFEIAAGGALYLQRGGHHAMLMGLTAPFVQGGEITMILTFEQAGEISIIVPIDNERDGEMPMEGMSREDMEGGSASPMAGMSNN